MMHERKARAWGGRVREPGTDVWQVRAAVYLSWH